MCSRVVLQRAVDRAAALGYTFNLGIETEFYLVRREQGAVVPANPIDVLAKAAYDIVDLLANMPFMDEVIGYMNQLGWDVHSFDHEDSNSQFEFDFSYTDVMSMADRQTLWRMMVKEVARRHGAEATLMPKPYSTRTGTGSSFGYAASSLATPSGAESRQIAVTAAAPRDTSMPTTVSSVPPVASIGSSTKASRPARSSGSRAA